MPAQTIEQLAVNTMIAPVTDWAQRMARDYEIQRAMWTPEQIAEIEAGLQAETATFANGAPVTDADRAEAVTLCQSCGEMPARWLDGGWWDCDTCRERARLDEPDYD